MPVRPMDPILDPGSPENGFMEPKYFTVSEFDEVHPVHHHLTLGDP